MKKKPLSVFDRCFNAADRWLRHRYSLPRDSSLTHEQNIMHIGYRCGWAAGYERARREIRNSASDRRAEQGEK